MITFANRHGCGSFLRCPGQSKKRSSHSCRSTNQVLRIAFLAFRVGCGPAGFLVREISCSVSWSSPYIRTFCTCWQAHRRAWVGRKDEWLSTCTEPSSVQLVFQTSLKYISTVNLIVSLIHRPKLLVYHLLVHFQIGLKKAPDALLSCGIF